jgi:hypothetical protein
MIFICPKCGFEIKNSRNKHVACCDGSGPRRKKKKLKRGSYEWKQKIKNTMISKWKNENYRSKVLNGIHNSQRMFLGNWGNASTQEKEIVKREKLRIKINERYANGWEVKCGRCKKIDYYSDIAGHVKLDGTWELAVARYFDNNKIKWTRNKKRFEYINLKNKISTYCPDFYIEEWGTYLEIKGYETNLDRCKWEQFKDPLIIWKKNDLMKFNII